MRQMHVMTTTKKHIVYLSGYTQINRNFDNIHSAHF